MEALLWLAPLPLAVVLAALRNAWVTRRPRARAAHDTVAEHQRFLAAVAPGGARGRHGRRG